MLKYTIYKLLFLAFTTNVACIVREPGGGGGGTGTDDGIRNRMASNESKADSTNAILTALVDGGNSDVLEQQVIESMPPEAYDLYMSLMGKSPYLSDSVMMAAVEKENVLPNILVKDILVANPQAAKSEKVMQKVDEKANPMSDDMKAEILLGKYIVAAKEKLEAQVDWYKHQRAMALNDLKRYYLADTLNQLATDSLIMLLEQESGLNEKYELAFEYMNKGDYNTASGVITGIPAQFSLNSQQQEYYNDLNTLYGVLSDLHQADTTYEGLTESQTGTLIQLADNSQYRAGAYARNILMYLDKYAYTPPIILPDTGMKSSNAIEIEKPVKKSFPKLKLYPNPAYDYVVVEMLIGNVSGADIEIDDNSGRKVLNAKLPAKSQQRVISLKGLSRGIYILKIVYEGIVLDTEKITVIK